MNPSKERFFSKNFNAYEQEYQYALAQLNAGLHNIPPEKQELVLQVQKTLEQIIRLKKEGKTPVTELIESLRNTTALLQGQLTPEQYQTYAKKVEESPSNGMKTLGSIMIVLGMIAIVAGIVLITTGCLAEGAIASGLGYIAMDFFSEQINQPHI